MKTRLAKNIEVARLKERCDAACKRLLSQKYILAWIMKSCMAEYKDSAIADIAEKYIEGTPEVGSTPVDADEPDWAQEIDTRTADRIQGADSEDNSITEGTVRYDIKYKATVPSTKQTVQLIINIEAQNKYHPDYPLLKRAVYYCGRLISAQKGAEFTGSHYGKLKKVYSVWICIKPPERKQNTITRYRLREENLVGTVKAKRALRPDSDCDGEPRQQGRQSGICQYRLTYKKDAFMKYAKTFRNDILRNVLPSENKT